jgi:electron transport complex protein RnfB
MALGYLPADDGAVVIVIVLAAAAMTLAALALRRAQTPLSQRIDAVLPQTQCTQCGYAGCMPYAEAVAANEAAINRCPPGGNRVIRKLSRITARPYIALDSRCGVHKPRQVARIDEARCIGCTLCIRACPVDAIVGAPKLMHTVIGAECTGCELCLPPCPVDCIALEPAPWKPVDILLQRRSRAEARARSRFTSRLHRLERERHERAQRLARRNAEPASCSASPTSAELRKRAIVAAAVARARRKLAEEQPIET